MAPKSQTSCLVLTGLPKIPAGTGWRVRLCTGMCHAAWRHVGSRMQQLKKIDKGLPEIMICGRSLDVFLGDIEHFHGFTSPGLILGGFMVDWAQELIGPGVEADAVVETCHCLRTLFRY